jgi:hypothetical protein
MHEQIIYQFLVLNNIHKISSNKVQLVDQFLQANRNQTRLRLGKNYQLQKIDKILILKKEIYKNI